MPLQLAVSRNEEVRRCCYCWLTGLNSGVKESTFPPDPSRPAQAVWQFRQQIQMMDITPPLSCPVGETLRPMSGIAIALRCTGSFGSYIVLGYAVG